MDLRTPQHLFQSLLPQLTTARDKVFELSGLLMQHHTAAPALVSLWFDTLNATSDDKKRQALLYVMNDVVIKTSRSSEQQTEYLQAFSDVLDNVIACLVVGKNELLLEEVRQMVLVWEDGKNCVFAPQYTSRLKAKVAEAISAVLDEKSGASVIQNFELTEMLRKVEGSRASLEPLAAKVEKLSQYSTHPRRMPSNSHAEPEKLRDLRASIQQFQEKCERLLAERTSALLRLSQELQVQYEIYNSFETRAQELYASIDSKDSLDQDKRRSPYPRFS